MRAAAFAARPAPFSDSPLPADPNLAWVGAFISGRLVALARLEIKGESAVADLLLPKPFIGFGNLQVRAGANPAELNSESATR